MDYTADDYHYTVEWSDEDGVFIGRVKEFELLAAHEYSEEKALLEIKKVVGYVLADMEADGNPIPPPQP